MREQLRSDDESMSGEPQVTIEMRVPGPWVSPEQLAAALVDRKTGYELGDGMLIDTLTSEQFEIAVTEHDDDLGPIFRGGHQGRMTDEELLAVGAHAVKVHVIGPGGSEKSAKRIVDATAALVRAGGYGVFVDNSGNCHGPEDFLKLADDPQDGGVFWTFVATTRSGENVVFSTGLHCLGFRDVDMHDPPGDERENWLAINEFLGYMTRSGREIHDGDHAGGAPPGMGLPHYVINAAPCTRYPEGTAFFNPFGIWVMRRAGPITTEDGSLDLNF